MSRQTGGADGLRVLLPLCGKAGCLLHLYNAGHTVVGDLDSSVTWNHFGFRFWIDMIF